MANGGNGRSRAELLDEIDQLQAENDDLQSQLDAIADIVTPPDEEGDLHSTAGCCHRPVCEAHRARDRPDPIRSCRAWPKRYMRAGKIPEGIKAVTVIAAQPMVEYQQRSRMKNHDRKQKCPTTELPTAAVIAGAQ